MKNRKKGFTLVELIVVIAIVAILAAIAVPTTFALVGNAKKQKVTEEANGLKDVVVQQMQSFATDKVADGGILNGTQVSAYFQEKEVYSKMKVSKDTKEQIKTIKLKMDLGKDEVTLEIVFNDVKIKAIEKTFNIATKAEAAIDVDLKELINKQ